MPALGTLNRPTRETVRASTCESTRIAFRFHLTRSLFFFALNLVSRPRKRARFPSCFALNLVSRQRKRAHFPSCFKEGPGKAREIHERKRATWARPTLRWLSRRIFQVLLEPADAQNAKPLNCLPVLYTFADLRSTGSRCTRDRDNRTTLRFLS